MCAAADALESNMSFSSAFLPSLVAMAEPQLPEPTSATFSLPAEPFPGLAAPLKATFLTGDPDVLPGDIALLLGCADASCTPSAGMLGCELPQPMRFDPGGVPLWTGDSVTDCAK